MNRRLTEKSSLRRAAESTQGGIRKSNDFITVLHHYTMVMRIRRLHRIIGIVLLLPFLGWAITGLIFFIKPGYEGAYEVLSPKTYSLDRAISISPDPSWLEFRYFRTILGEHLIARTN